MTGESIRLHASQRHEAIQRGQLRRPNINPDLMTSDVHLPFIGLRLGFGMVLT